MFLFKFKKVMTSINLPVQLDSQIKKKSSKIERKQYVKNYKNKIGLKGKLFISEKLPGPRVIWTGKHLLTKDLTPLYPPNTFLKLLGNIPLDGVLEGYNEPLTETDWKKIKFVVFDMPLPNLPFETRLNRLKRSKLILQSKIVKLHTFYEILRIENSFNQVNELYQKSLLNKKKGVMLIQASNIYQGKQTNSFITYKKQNFGKAKIVGYIEGIGKYYSFLGKYKCENEHGKIFYCSEDIPEIFRFKYHFDRTICKKIDSNDIPLIGDIITFTSDKMIKNGTVPRLPIYKSFERIN